MAINNTLQNTYSNIFSSKGKPLPTNDTVPKILGNLSPAQSALNNRIGNSAKNVISSLPSAPQTLIPKTPVATQNTQNTQTTNSIKGLVTPTTPTAQNLSIGGSPSVVNPNFSGVIGSQPVSGLPQTSTYSGLVSSLANKSNAPSQDYTDTKAKIEKLNEDLAKSKLNLANNLAGNANDPVDLAFQQGRGQVMTTQGLAQQNAIASELQGESNLLSAANTQQGLQQSGLTSAAGLAQPQLAGFNQQVFNPLTGKMEQGGGTMQDAVNNVVQKLTSGQMTYNDALTALSGYGQGGVNALQQALPEGFNIAQSNTLAAQQGQIKPAYDYAQTAITNLQNAVKDLGTGQNTNIPIINQIAQGFSTIFGVGSQGVQAYKGALAEARSAIQKVLASVQGGTPTDYVGQSNALLPDNATPNQIEAAAQTLQTLGQAKVNIYGNPGQSNSSKTSETIKTNYGDIDPNL